MRPIIKLFTISVYYQQEQSFIHVYSHNSDMYFSTFFVSLKEEGVTMYLQKDKITGHF